ncbi:hypothetical protein P9112_004084 [Eukaryota sp. TZLM1-RC]
MPNLSKNGTSQTNKNTFHRFPLGRLSFSRLNVDTIGPLNTDSDGNKYLLVFVDSFTGYSILVPLKELNALETTDALIWNVCAIFGIPMLIHSDNGPEFANESFKIVCNRLAIETSNSIPHYSESKGLVERKHRDVLQCLRKSLIEFNDYGNWSIYVPISQLFINSAKSRKTGFTSYELMFGSSISPRSDPANILGNLSKFDPNIPLLNDIRLKNIRLQEKREKAERYQTFNTPTSVDNTNSRFIVFNIGDYVLRKTKQNNILHGSWNGPFLVIDHPSNSTLLLKNLTTGSELMATKKDCTPITPRIFRILNSLRQSQQAMLKNTL